MHRPMTVILSALLILASTLTTATHAATGTPPQPNPLLRNILTVTDRISSHPPVLHLIEVTAPAGAVLQDDHAALVYGLHGAQVITQPGQGPVRVGPGEAWSLGAGAMHTQRVTVGPARFLLFFLTPAGAAPSALGAAPGVVQRMLYTSPAPVTALAPGSYELTVQEALWSPHAPLNGPHHRSGVGLYYILRGALTVVAAGTTRTIPAGAVHYEDPGYVHRNANRTAVPTQAVFFTLTPSGQQVVLQDTPAPPAPDATLRVYGAGGPLGPMRAALEAFKARTGIPVAITAGPTGTWLPAARTNGDLVYFGAEYVMDAFAYGTTYSGERRVATEGLIIPESRTSLYTRPSGLLVRPGNPRGIRSFQDLARPGLKILTVQGAGQTGVWEEMAARAGVLPGVGANIAVVAADGADAIRAWDARPDIDAWITWTSWHKQLPQTTQLVPIGPALRVYRSTPIAILRRTQHRAAAEAFLRFLQTPQAKAIFMTWGWSDPPVQGGS